MKRWCCYGPGVCSDLQMAPLSLLLLLLLPLSTLSTLSQSEPRGALSSSRRSPTEAGNVTIIFADFNTDVNVTVSRAMVTIVKYSYIFDNHTEQDMRIHVHSSHSSKMFPVLLVLKQQLGIMSWQIPLFADNRLGYSSVSRTLCPIQDYVDRSESSLICPNQSIYIDLSSASPTPVNLTLSLDTDDHFHIGLNQSIEVQSSPSQPQYLEVNFPEGIDELLVKVTSRNSNCAIVSIQDAVCPVFDLARDVTFDGMFLTMTTSAAIVATRSMHPNGFFIVLIVKSTDDACLPETNHNETANQDPNETRIKNFTIEVVNTISVDRYLIATFGVIGVFLLFCFLVVGIIYFFGRNTEESDVEGSENDLVENVPRNIRSDSVNNLMLKLNATASNEAPPSPLACGSSSSNNDSDDDCLLDDDTVIIQAIHDAGPVIRQAPLYVSDLAQGKPRTRAYCWNVITIAILYAVPVFQLVQTYHKAIRLGGNQDICFYNSLCAHPWGPFRDFNHFFSNVGYVMLGLLFLIIVLKRDLKHRKRLKTQNGDIEKYGIPQHSGFFYAMGFALIMEGVLSAGYHMCPNHSNFQFDTSFMYMIAGLCMLKIYQTRHPDIIVNAYTASFAFALVIATAVFGVMFGNIYIWSLSVAIHIVICVIISFKFYFMGRWNLNLGSFKRIFLQCNWNILRGHICEGPMHWSRFCLVLFTNLINWAIAIYFVIERTGAFATYLLAIFLGNLPVYLIFYIRMKYRQGERLLLLPWLFIGISLVFWGPSLYFFMARPAIDWNLTPAHSREKNCECTIIGFYDYHDIWHFLSAAGIFLSYMVLLTMDDDLIFIKRNKIWIF